MADPAVGYSHVPYEFSVVRVEQPRSRVKRGNRTSSKPNKHNRKTRDAAALAVTIEHMPGISPLDVFGDSSLRTRHQLATIINIARTQMPSKVLEETGVLTALDQLAHYMAKDMKRVMDRSWQSGVAHGEWLTPGIEVQATRECWVDPLTLPFLPQPVPPAAALPPSAPPNTPEQEDPLFSDELNLISLEELERHIDALLDDSDKENEDPQPTGYQPPSEPHPLCNQAAEGLRQALITLRV